MVLSPEQLTALVDLRRRANELEAAKWAYEEAEGLCFSMSISLRQIAKMGRSSGVTVRRRQLRRVAQLQAVTNA